VATDTKIRHGTTTPTLRERFDNALKSNGDSYGLVRRSEHEGAQDISLVFEFKASKKAEKKLRDWNRIDDFRYDDEIYFGSFELAMGEKPATLYIWYNLKLSEGQVGVLSYPKGSDAKVIENLGVLLDVLEKAVPKESLMDSIQNAWDRVTHFLRR
jgi:hypothetical protein